MDIKTVKGRHLKKITSFILIFLMVFGMVPWQDIKAYAFDADKYYVDYIAITKIYDKGGYDVTQTKLTIHGGFLKDVTSGTRTSSGYKMFTNRIINTDSVVEFMVEGDIVGNSIDVGSIEIPINQKQIPALSNIDRRSVKAGKEGITLSGSNLDKVGKTEGTAVYSSYYENKTGAGGTNNLPINQALSNSEKIVTHDPNSGTGLTGTPGFQTIVLQMQDETYINFKNNNSNIINDGSVNNGKNKVELIIQNTYIDQFRLVNEITPVNISMNPNRGQAGSGSELGDEVTFTADSGLDNYDVFFLKNLTDKFTNDNKGVDTQFTPNVDGKQVLKTHVPVKKTGVIENGEYFVVITNKIPTGKDPDEQINKQYIMGDYANPNSPIYEKFTIIDASQKMKIISIKPNEGPDTGSKAEISGLFFGTLNIPEFQPVDNNKTVDLPAGKDEIMTINYSNGTYKGQTVTDANRTVKVIVGDIAKFVKKADNSYEYNFTDALDTISIITPQISDAETSPVKDVVIESITTLTLQSGEKVVIKERAELKKGYTYKASKLTPKVNSVTPDKIQVTKITDGDYKIDENRLIAIDGENFLIHKYIKADGTESVRYPIVEIGNDIRLNKNNNGDKSNPDLELKVFDKLGNELDGSVGNEVGSKILVYLPKDTKITLPGKTFVKVINPIRNTETEGLSDRKLDAVEFVTSTDNPIIGSVNPYIVTVNGGEDVAIIGSNFKDGVKVFIDGAEVTSIKREGDGKKITFKAPKGREGTTQLQVMNPSGAIATHDFIYVKTYTDPKITSFSPNKGSHGTLVFVKGDNFLKPDPATVDITGANIYKIIGSRILLGTNDINQYNKDQSNKIILKDYKAPDDKKILYTDGNGSLKMQDYYQSIILEDDSKQNSFYTFDINSKSEIVLSNGKDETYTIKKETADGFEAVSSEGLSYTISLSSDSDKDMIVIKEVTSGNIIRTLNIRTVYTVENNIITGHKVKILNKSELLFTVPIMDVEKWYDLTVQNPDTKKDSRLGTNGFYYFKTPKKHPTITYLDPPQGSVDGGYSVDIYGSDFEANGDVKSRVFIGGVEVPAADVIISTDKAKITIKMPKYPGDLKTEIETDRKTVPVVVTNSDGGNAKKEDGFTYVIPTSNPKITKILPATGNAAGGEIIQIWGSDFRYFEPYIDLNGNASYDSNEKFTNLNGLEDGNSVWDNLEDKATYDRLKADYKNKVIPILPKIYFGKRQAEIIDFADGYISVKTPVGEKGNVDVYVLNNDFGTSNKVPFTYKASDPKITKVVPNIGKKQGGDKVEILGSEFAQSKINLLTENGIEENIITLVRFGDVKDKNISNKTINAGEQNAGTIIGTMGETTVGDLTVKYNSSDLTNKTLTLSAKVKDITYEKVIQHYDDSAIYVPLNLLSYTDSNNQTSRYNGKELVKISIDSSARRMIIERGYAPQGNLINQGQVEVITPSYYTIGTVPVTIINPDGGEAVSTFEYKNPDSHPQITNITKELEAPTKVETIGDKKDIKVIRINYKGGSNISVIGTDFRENAKISIGDILEIPYSSITPNLPDKLTFKMPAVNETSIGKLYKVTVLNEDGASATSEDITPNPIYIMFTKGETAPKIEKVTPDSGPSSGGTKVKIEGLDFRKSIDGYDSKFIVYFGGTKLEYDINNPDNKIEFVDYKTINVITPPHAPGKVDIKIENPDGETAELKDAFTYLSNPKISGVFKDGKTVDTISTDGGEELKITGSDFMEGARVVFVPVLEEVKGDTTSGDVIIINGTKYILKSGIDAKEVKFIDSTNLKVITPVGTLDGKGVIVINPDKVATNVYQGIKYSLSKIPAPTGVTASLIYDKYIKVSWNPVDGAQEYEVYAIVDDESPEFIGSTDLTSFIYQDLEPKTEYRFIVKAIGKNGLSLASSESNTVETGRSVGPDDTDGGLNENTNSNKTGDTANVSIGTKDYSDKEIKIDLTKGSLAGSKEVVISIPASVVASYSAKDITVVGKDFTLKFNPTAFNVSKVEENKKKNDAGVKFKISPYNEKSSDSLSTEYTLTASAFVGKDNTSIDYLRSKIDFTLDYDINKSDMRKLKNVAVYRYDESYGGWVYMKQRMDEYSSSIAASVDRLGRYSIIGSRR